MPDLQHQRTPWLEQAFDFATQEATGQLVIVSPNGDHSWLWIRDGQLTGVSAPARRPLLAQRLVSFGILDSRTIAKALATAREVPGTRLIDVILVENLAPETFLSDYLLATAAEQMHQIQDAGFRESRFHPGRTQRLSPLLIDLHDVAASAQTDTHRIRPEIADLAVSALSHDSVTSTICQSLMSASDGHRRPIQIADHLGLTIQEISTLLDQLVADGAVEIVAPTGQTTSTSDEGLLTTPFPQENSEPVESQESASEIMDLPPPTAPTTETTEGEKPAFERISGAFRPANIRSGHPNPAQGRTKPPAPDPELRQMATELAPTLPDGADLSDPEDVPQHHIVGSPSDHKDAASLLTSLSHGQQSPEKSDPIPMDAPPPALTPPPVQISRPVGGTEPAMNPDLLGELHSVQDPQDSDTPTQQNASPVPHKRPQPPPKRRLFGR